MPEYLAPGVYVEEVSFRSKSIEGVSTTTTGFVGPTRYGPLDLDNELLTSLGDFARVYGNGAQLRLDGSTFHNYMWHAARAFFIEGGKRLYVSRVFRRLDSGPSSPAPGTVDSPPTLLSAGYADGYARGPSNGRLSSTAAAGSSLRVRARWPGAAGNVRVRFNLRVSKSVLGFDQRRDPITNAVVDVPRVSALLDRDVVLISRGTSPVSAQFYQATFNEVTGSFEFTRTGSTTLKLTGNTPPDFARGDKIQVITAAVSVLPGDGLGLAEVWDNLALDALHSQNGANDSLAYQFGSFVDDPAQFERASNRDKPIVVAGESSVSTGLDVLAAFFEAAPAIVHSPAQPGDQPSLRDKLLGDFADADRFVEIVLTGGNDGKILSATEYEGASDPSSSVKTGLKQFEDIDDLSIVAAPGSTFNYETRRDDANTIVSLLIEHCQYMRYRIAVVDSGNGQTLNQVQDMRARFDSSWAALYYPWVRVLDPVTRAPIFLPPSGFVSGIYARNDTVRAVYKAPANEVVNLSIGFELLLNKAQQDVLNPVGINCFRFFENRGNRLWGGRTMSSDPEWKYVSLRRYFAYLEHSIDRGTQWAVFEPNGPLLWNNVRQTIVDFLLAEFFAGALLGDRPEQSFFVKCDRTTMTQNDLDNGRLICLIGVAPVKPAEFVIFRIGQWTADRK
jgi:phage tail sheath protein FI